MYTAKAGCLSLSARISKVIGQQCANKATLCWYYKKRFSFWVFLCKRRSDKSKGAPMASVVFLLERVWFNYQSYWSFPFWSKSKCAGFMKVPLTTTSSLQFTICKVKFINYIVQVTVWNTLDCMSGIQVQQQQIICPAKDILGSSSKQSIEQHNFRRLLITHGIKKLSKVLQS